MPTRMRPIHYVSDVSLPSLAQLTRLLHSLIRLSSGPFHSSLFRSSTIPIEVTMPFIILQPDDLHRMVGIESDLTFHVAMKQQR